MAIISEIFGVLLMAMGIGTLVGVMSFMVRLTYDILAYHFIKNKVVNVHKPSGWRLITVTGKTKEKMLNACDAQALESKKSFHELMSGKAKKGGE